MYTAVTAPPRTASVTPIARLVRKAARRTRAGAVAGAAATGRAAITPAVLELTSAWVGMARIVLLSSIDASAWADWTFRHADGTPKRAPDAVMRTTPPV